MVSSNGVMKGWESHLRRGDWVEYVEMRRRVVRGAEAWEREPIAHWMQE